MDCRTGEISHLYLDEFDDIEKLTDKMDSDKRKRLEDIFNANKTKRHMLALTELEEKELTPLSKRERKNKMRNKPCICGSGIKFKKCCWSKYA